MLHERLGSDLLNSNARYMCCSGCMARGVCHVCQRARLTWVGDGFGVEAG
jgi:hypothetical protein